jgi:hypothetical protein
MSILLPAYLTAVGLLGGSAVAKLRRPDAASAALHVPRALVRAASLVELGVAASMVVRPAVGGLAGCALFLCFAALVVGQLWRGSGRSCGCLGSAELPPSRAHVAVNVVFAGVALVRPGAPSLSFTGLVVCVAAAATAWAVAAALELVPAALSAYRRPVA